MTAYSVTVSKKEKDSDKVDWDQKHSVSAQTITTKEQLQNKFNELKIKYNAQELPELESTMGPMRSFGLFKVAKGACKHGKEVYIAYNQVEGDEKHAPSIIN